MDFWDTISWDEPSPQQLFEEKEIKNNTFAKELAFHEASHLVIERLVNKLDLGFSEPISMYIDTEKRIGCVHGFGFSTGKTIDYWTKLNEEKFTQFYKTDTRRIWAECLTLIAGYGSYKVYIEETDYFIGHIDSNSNKAKMYKLGNVPHGTLFGRANKYHTDVSDFAKIKERLSMIKICEDDQRLQVYQKLLDDISLIMKIPAVENAIRYAKNRLLYADGKGEGKVKGIIEGKRFEYCKFFVDKLIKRVKIEDVLRSYDLYTPHE